MTTEAATLYADDPRTLPWMQRYLYLFIGLNAIGWALVYFMTSLYAPVANQVALLVGEALCAYALVFWAVLSTGFSARRKAVVILLSLPATWALQMGVAAILRWALIAMATAQAG